MSAVPLQNTNATFLDFHRATVCLSKPPVSSITALTELQMLLNGDAEGMPACKKSIGKLYDQFIDFVKKRQATNPGRIVVLFSRRASDKYVDYDLAQFENDTDIELKKVGWLRAKIRQ